ncbi:protein-arginine deiminase family protein [Streptomyces turgidiscabies]|uniref:Protein-arginine deiminase C-terminal domain-containing protein n=1 Tax=Streptomyces turgidiscabies TaxID=85558 RepID=A0ABU0RPJ7_9ACTN|nr:hypothetical protein [Streptomyces turgidiscabies]
MTASRVHLSETTWTSGRGAIFLPNLGDKQRRCRTKTPDGRWLSNAQLQACNDAQGNVVRAPEYLAYLRTVPVTDVSDAATGSFQLIGAGKSKVRLFLERGDTWTYVTAGTRVTAAELRAELRLGLDGRDVIRQDWDGRITVRFTVTDGDRTSTDEVMLRAAPVLTQHHLQRAEQALVVEGNRDDPNQRKFAREFAKEVREAGITKPTYKFKDGSDVWAQDFIEPGYVSMPGPGGKPRVLRMMIRSRRWTASPASRSSNCAAQVSASCRSRRGRTTRRVGPASSPSPTAERTSRSVTRWPSSRPRCSCWAGGPERCPCCLLSWWPRSTPERSS